MIRSLSEKPKSILHFAAGERKLFFSLSPFQSPLYFPSEEHRQSSSRRDQGGPLHRIMSQFPGEGRVRGGRFVPSRGNWMPACRQLIRHTSLEHRRSTRIAASCIFPLKLPLTIPPLPSLLPSSVHFRPIKNAVILGNRCLNAR